MTAPWPALPPEEAYNLLALGEGEATTVASGAAWQAQTIEGLTNAGLSEGNAAMTAPAWVGLGGTASGTSASVMNGILSALSGWAQAKVPIAETAAVAYRTAVSMMVPTPECLENRTEWAHDNAINPLVWGALTPEIVRLDTQYFGVYWPNNAAQGTAYSTLLTGFLSTLAVPPPIGPPAASPGAPAAAAGQIASATAESAAGDAMRESMQSGFSVTDQLAGGPASGAQSLMEPVMSAAQAPMQAVQSLGSPFEALSSPLEQATAPLSQFAGMFGMFGQGGAVPANAMPGGAPASPVSAMSAVSSTGGGTGVVSGGGGGYVSPTGLTNYTRPTSSFGPEATKGGAATYARPTTVTSGASSVPVTGGGVPYAPMGMMRNGDSKSKEDEVKTARLSM